MNKPDCKGAGGIGTQVLVSKLELSLVPLFANSQSVAIDPRLVVTMIQISYTVLLFSCDRHWVFCETLTMFFSMTTGMRRPLTIRLMFSITDVMLMPFGGVILHWILTKDL